MRKIDPNSGAATVLSGRLPDPEIGWFDETSAELGYKSRSEFLREVVRIARKHQEDLQAAS
ncbi:hypothetical protein GCM10023258_39810 [Terrabacter aeriphilus]|uniref:Ribbon-helix-helix protein CopG domain-containing protein n=1 Tax=Terrabacter aeriphilus TaxID=515662 RepID=A0ABP9JMP6_9MICO